MSSLDVKESKIAHPSGPGRSLVADLRRSKPYRDLTPMRQLNWEKKSIFKDFRYCRFSVGGGWGREGVSKKRPNDVSREKIHL